MVEHTSHIIVAVVCFTLLYDGVYSQQNGDPCSTQAECDESRGFRCQYRVGRGVRVACEIKPDGVNTQCKCKKGCLFCTGGADSGLSVFIRQHKSIITSCGINWSTCTDAASNSIAHTIAACTDPVWFQHC